MGWLFRGVIRVFTVLVAASTLLACGSAVVAAVARRRIQVTEDPASNAPTAASVFSGERFVSSAPALNGGRVITWFAGHDVDLRGATLDPAGATLDLQVMYGGTQIAVPEGWRVRSHVLSIVGGTQIDIGDANPGRRTAARAAWLHAVRRGPGHDQPGGVLERRRSRRGGAAARG